MISLGQKAKDTITGFKGIAVARTEYLQGCRRVGLQPLKLKDGLPQEAQWFDEPQLVSLPSRKHKRKNDTGGPGIVPPNRISPTPR